MMKIQSATLQGFRCFGEVPTTVRLSEGITTLVGANASGKTAFLDALLRVFGMTREQRAIQRTDFHVPVGTPTYDRSSRELYIDIRLVFPELEQEKPAAHAVAPCFHHMVVEKPGGTLFCRARLEAKWTDDGTADGNIEQKLWWVLTDGDTPTDEQKRPFESHERGLIQVHYVPATRDASKQLTYATWAVVGRLLRAIDWSPTTKQAVEEASQRIREAFGNETAIQTINDALVRRWGELHDAPVDAEPEMHVFSRQFEEVIRRFSVAFRPTETDGEREFDALSDGQKSLFYFSLAAAVFDIERKILESNNGANMVDTDTISGKLNTQSNGNSASPSTNGVEMLSITGFQNKWLRTPSLTVFALEEPENHLAPYFLARIIKQVRSVVKSQTAQAVFTSHSPAILGRIDPTEVRHFRLNPQSRTSIVREIMLPDSSEEATKYVREAVIAYPEVYFARFVILVEGASEQVVLPRLASARGHDIDRSFVAVTPLGGRHVNHFWKLLFDLDIPYATLIDLDLGRDDGGWGRVKYVCDQLLSIGMSREQLLTIVDGSGNQRVLSEEGFEQLHTWDTHAIKDLKAWIRALEYYGVFFSPPLDLDMAMLSRFPEAYKAIAPAGRGPRIPPTDTPRYEDYIEEAAKAVLGETELGRSVHSAKWQRWFPWYRYLFLGKSKPSTHLLALSQIDDEELASNAPSVLKRLLDYVNGQLHLVEEDGS